MLELNEAARLRPAQPPDRTGVERRRDLWRARVLRWLDANALFLAALAAVAAIAFGEAGRDLNQDGWLALVAGRAVAQHGIPHFELLTIMAHGRSWIDQQWLSQWLIYRIETAGGLQLYALVYVLLVLSGGAMAIAAARSLGAGERHVVWILPLAGFLYFAGATQIRTQGFAYPFFAATLWLLARDVRHPSRQVYFTLPLLCIWANLHGSVTMGVAMCGLFGLCVLGRNLTAGGDLRQAVKEKRLGKPSLKAITFLVAPPVALLATPYGFSVADYYRDTLLNPSFGKLITEWRPISSVTILAVPFFVAAFAAVWLLGRSGRRTPAFDQLALIVLGLGAMLAVRNVSWFGLGLIVLLPRVCAGIFVSRPPARRTRINHLLGAVSLLMILLSILAMVTRPSRWFESGYDLRAARSVAATVAQRPGIRVFADLRYADWLLWHDPQLAGHIAYDIRFELLSQRQLTALASLGDPSPGKFDLLRGYPLLVLDPQTGSIKSLLSRHHARVTLRGHRVIIATAPA